MTIGSPFGLLFTTAMMASSLSGGAVILLLLLTGFMVVAGARLWLRKPGAPTVAQVAFICMGLTNAFTAVTMRDQGLIDVGVETQTIIGSLVGSLIWVAYLARSKRVKATFAQPSGTARAAEMDATRNDGEFAAHRTSAVAVFLMVALVVISAAFILRFMSQQTPSVVAHPPTQGDPETLRFIRDWQKNHPDNNEYWTGYIYPDRSNLTNSKLIGYYDSLESCRGVAQEQLASINASERGDYECGYKCKPLRTGSDMVLCDRTER